ncbi:MAG: hypothetical protein QNJ47_05290 [Nostocaceae cyanobacterium]|nr:hypothetical protein [Nostocaceae cyanobacterium]
MLWKLVVSAFILPSFLGLEIAAASSIKNNVQTLAESEITQTQIHQDLDNQENNPYKISHHRRNRYRRNHYRRNNRRRHYYRRRNYRRTYKNSNYWRNYYRGYYRTLYNRRYNQDCPDSHYDGYRYYRTRNRRYYDH